MAYLHTNIILVYEHCLIYFRVCLCMALCICLVFDPRHAIGLFPDCVRLFCVKSCIYSLLCSRVLAKCILQFRALFSVPCIYSYFVFYLMKLFYIMKQFTAHHTFYTLIIKYIIFFNIYIYSNFIHL